MLLVLNLVWRVLNHFARTKLSVAITNVNLVLPLLSFVLPVLNVVLPPLNLVFVREQHHPLCRFWWHGAKIDKRRSCEVGPNNVQTSPALV